MSWDNLERNVSRGPMSAFMSVFGILLLVSVVVGGTGYVLGWFSEAAQVT